MPIPNGFSNVTLHFRTPAGGGSRDSVTTFGVEGSPNVTTAAEIAGAFVDEVWTTLGSSQVTFTAVTMRDEVNVVEYPLATVGGAGGELSDPQCSVLIRKLTGLAGRRNRGRMYPPGQCFNGTFDQGGNMSTSNQVTYTGAWEDFRQALEALDATMVILHGGSSDTSPVTVTQLVADPLVATQRRRTGR